MTDSPGDKLERLLEGKEAIRPVYDYLRAQIELLGADVTVEPKDDYVSFSRGRQFALIRPSATTSVDLGLVLPDAAPTARFADAGSFGSSVTTHRVAIVSEADVDGELLVWLREAYDAAGG